MPDTIEIQIMLKGLFLCVIWAYNTGLQNINDND